MAGAANVSPTRDAMMAETLAYKFVLEAAEAHGISRIELETDSAMQREALVTSSRDFAPDGVLFTGIRELLNDHFRCEFIRNIPRSCNSVAHEIARLDMSWDLEQSIV
jgi:hypothetical protein